jgi:MFS family permease
MYSCEPKDFCGNPSITYKPDYDLTHYKDGESKPLHNWTEKLDLACVSDYKIGLIGSSYFIGWVCTLLIFPGLADYFGRKWIYRIALMVSFVLYAGIYFCQNINLMIGIMFCLGAFTTARISVGFVYMLEFVRVKH